MPVLRCKMLAIMISAALTALAGVWNAFYYNNLFPETAFAMGRSIEITLAPIIGGLGTLFGPIVGAVVLTGLGEIFTDLGDVLRHSRHQADLLRPRAAGDRDVPAGRRLAVARRQARLQGATMSGARLDLAGLGKNFRGLRAVHDVSFTVPAGAIHALIGPNGAGKTTIFNMIAGVIAPTPAPSRLDGRPISGLRPDRVCDAGVGRTFQIVRAVQGPERAGERHRRRAAPPAPSRRGARRAPRRSCRGSASHDRRHQLAESLTLPDRKRLEVARALATEPKLLLLDEVMAGLRPTEVDVMVGFLRELNAEHRAHHPADRACHARGHGARRRRSWW